MFELGAKYQQAGLMLTPHDCQPVDQFIFAEVRGLDRTEQARIYKVFVVRVINIELRGAHYRVLLDGHHNLAAARLARVDPRWKGPPAKFERIRKRMKPEEFAAFLINNLTDSDWYFVETGEVVEELLAPEI